MRAMKLTVLLLLLSLMTSLAWADDAQTCGGAPQIMWVKSSAIRGPEFKDYFSAEGIQTAWPAMLLNSQGWLLLSTSGQMDLSIPTRLRVRAADGKEYDARYEAYDKKLGLAFVRIIDWPANQEYSLDWKPCEWSAGQLVSALSCLDAANQHAAVRIYARVAGRSADSYHSPLLDRDLAPYRGLPILDQDGGLVGIVGSSSNGVARVISQGELESLLRRLERTV